MLQRNKSARVRSVVAVSALLALVGCQEFQRPGESLGMPRTAPGRRMHGAAQRSLYVEARGSGAHTPVLFVHGFASNRETWVTIEPSLRGTRRTVAVDLPGFGYSDRLPGDYSPNAIADDLRAVLDQLAIDKVDVVAHSWGSSVSLAFALRYPTRVRRIVLMGAWAYEEQIPPFFRWAREPGMGEALFELFYRERLDDRAPMGFAAGHEVSQETVDAIERSLERPGTLRAALAAVRGQYYLQLEREYHRVTAPTLVIYGEEDRVALPMYGARLATTLGDARLVTLPRTGHFPMFESAGTTRTMVRDFLDRVDVAEPSTAAQSGGAAVVATPVQTTTTTTTQETPVVAPQTEPAPVSDGGAL